MILLLTVFNMAINNLYKMKYSLKLISRPSDQRSTLTSNYVYQPSLLLSQRKKSKEQPLEPVYSQTVNHLRLEVEPHCCNKLNLIFYVGFVLSGGKTKDLQRPALFAMAFCNEGLYAAGSVRHSLCY